MGPLPNSPCKTPPLQIIGNITFDDYDLDANDLGGNLTWIEPTDVSQVERNPGDDDMISGENT